MPTSFKQHTDNASAYIATSGALDNTTNPITIDLSANKGSLFASPGNGQYVTIWDKVSYPDPGDDPAMEKATITARSSDSITLSRPNAVAHAGTPVIAELPRVVHFTDIETAVNTTETNLATVQSDVSTLQTSVESKSPALFDAVIATSGGDYTTIGAAFADGKFRLKVMPGTYTETTSALNTYTISGKSIYIEGMDKKYCTLMLWNNTSGGCDFKAPTVIRNMTLACPASTTAPSLNSAWYSVTACAVTLENCYLSGSNIDSPASLLYTTGSMSSILSLINCTLTKSHGGHLINLSSLSRVIANGNVFDLESISSSANRGIFAGCPMEAIITNNIFRGGTDSAVYSLISLSSDGSTLDKFQNIIISNNSCLRSYMQFASVSLKNGNIVFSNNTVQNYSTTALFIVSLNTGGTGAVSCTGNDLKLVSAKNGAVLLKIFYPNGSAITGNSLKNYSTATGLTGLYVNIPDKSAIVGNAVVGFNTTTSVGICTGGSGTYTISGNICTDNTTDYTLTGTPIASFNGTLRGDTTTTAPTTATGGTVTNRYGGDTNFLGDPVSWMPIVIGTTTYKIPMYT